MVFLKLSFENAGNACIIEKSVNIYSADVGNQEFYPSLVPDELCENIIKNSLYKFIQSKLSHFYTASCRKCCFCT